VQEVGQVMHVFVSVQGTSGRVEKESVHLDPKGIVEDKYYDKNIQRSVLLASEASYALAQSYGIAIPFGLLGENILMDYNPYHLRAGDQIRIGEVVLQISQNCTMCDHLSNIDERLPELLQHDRGIFAKVIEGGSIQKNDKVFLLDA
jgi:MOSC domain-containing protein YiiM